ncbi:hypothetical protein V8F33_013884 [Rhypophila sp. PSN 637]
MRTAATSFPLAALLCRVGVLAHPAHSTGIVHLGRDIHIHRHPQVPAAEVDCTQGPVPSSAHWLIDNLVLKVYNWDNGGTNGTFGF